MNQCDVDRIRPGDFVSFQFPYRNGESYYARPSLVLEVTAEELLLAYCTTSRERANVGYEVRVNSEFAACGLDRQSRVVLARRVRVPKSDPRFDENGSGTSVLGRLTPALQDRTTALMRRIGDSWDDAERRLEAERRGIHPRPGRGRRRAGRPYRV